MMLYLFTKQNDNVVCLGADCDVPAQLAEKVAEYSNAGYELSDVAEFTKQLLAGAQAVPAPEAHSEPAPEAPVEAPVAPAAE